jgi:hypothetical protein
MITILEQRWLDDCFHQLQLDVDVGVSVIVDDDDGVSIIVDDDVDPYREHRQKALLFLAEHVEWFNYVVSKSHWGSPLKGSPATANDYINSDDDPEIRKKMAKLANRPRNVVRVRPPTVGSELHSTTCAWFEINMFERRGRGSYFALRDQFDRGDFETDEVEFRDFLVKESLVSQTTVWDLADANSLLEQMIASPKCDRVGPPQSEGSRTLSCLIIDVIRKTDQIITAEKIMGALIDHIEAALREGQRFDDLDLHGGQIVVGAKDLTDSALLTRISTLTRGLALI